MKQRNFGWVVSLATLLFWALRSFGQGTIATGSIVLYYPPPGQAPPGTYLRSTAYGGDMGGFFVLMLSTIAPGQYQMNYYGIAETYSVHAATEGLSLTPAYISGNSPLLSNTGNPASYPFSLGINQSVIFGYWDNAGYMPSSSMPGAPGNPAPDIYDAYGWFRLTRTASGLVIADSATALGLGIIAGTYNAVPEPTGAAILFTGTVVLRFWRRSCRR